MHLVNGTGNSPSLGQPTPGVVKQDKSSRGSVDTTKTRSDPRRVRMSSGERPIGAVKGKQSDTEALCQPPPPNTQTAHKPAPAQMRAPRPGPAGTAWPRGGLPKAQSDAACGPDGTPRPRNRAVRAADGTTAKGAQRPARKALASAPEGPRGGRWRNDRY